MEVFGGKKHKMLSHKDYFMSCCCRVTFNKWSCIPSLLFQVSCFSIHYLSKGADMKPRGPSWGSLVMTTTSSWLTITFILSKTCGYVYFNKLLMTEVFQKYSLECYSSHLSWFKLHFNLNVVVFCINLPCFFFFCVTRLRVPVSCTTEINHLGHQFLQRLFDKYDEVSCSFCCRNHTFIYVLQM